MLNLQDRRNIEQRKPLLVAHRGGVVSRDTPENSLAAIRLASDRGYDMVELDVREAKDRVPMLFHGPAGTDHLLVDCGIDRRLEELTSDELSSIRYRLSTQTIARLSDALELCAALHLAVMLDIKTATPSDAFLQHISQSLNRNGLVSSAVTLSLSPRVEQQLEGVLIFPVHEEDLARVLNAEAVDLRGRFYFEWGSRIEQKAVPLVQASGAFVIASINSFHYPRHARRALAGQDIQRMSKAGVDGFQIDDEFRELVPDRRK